jgi:hypothetical protein
MIENMIGKRFCKLVVKEFAERNKNKSFRFLCQCDCGNTIILKSTALVDKIVSSCGCDFDKNNVIGKKFGRLTIESKVNGNTKTQYVCRCDCGNTTQQRLNSLMKGYVKSCGCLGKEIHSKGLPVHNLYYTRIHTIYMGMKRRCYCKTDYHYANYGARGIKICDEWLGKYGIVSFYNWAMENGYEDTLSIDRIDNNGDYSPENCKWATNEQQQSNTRYNKWFEYNNEKLTFSQLARKLGIHTSTLYHRIKKHNGNIYDALKSPINHNLNRYKVKSGN